MLRPLQKDDSNGGEWMHGYPEPINNDAFTTEVIASSGFVDSDSHIFKRRTEYM
jgi:hypothetical protein